MTGKKFSPLQLNALPSETIAIDRPLRVKSSIEGN